MSRRSVLPFPWERDPRRNALAVDDFSRGTTMAGEIGDFGWSWASVGGGGGSVQLPTAASLPGTASGVIGVRANGGGGPDSFTLREGRRARTFADFAVGSMMSIRVHAPSISNMTWYAGLTDAHNVVPDAAAVMDFVGFRYEAATDGNVYGLIKTDAGGGSEDSGVIAAMGTTAFQTFTMKRTAATEYLLTAPGGTSTSQITAVTSFPATTEDCEFVIGIESTVAATRDLYIDFWMDDLEMDRR